MTFATGSRRFGKRQGSGRAGKSQKGERVAKESDQPPAEAGDLNMKRKEGRGGELDLLVQRLVGRNAAIPRKKTTRRIRASGEWGKKGG